MERSSSAELVAYIVAAVEQVDKQPCLKQKVYAMLVSLDGRESFGSNWIGTSEITECPRKDMKSGQGYHYCTEVCGQPGHAEVMAISRCIEEGGDPTGGTLCIVGHSYVCANCLAEVDKHGVEKVLILDELGSLKYSWVRGGGVIG